MYLLLEVLDDGYRVFDTVRKSNTVVPKTEKAVAGVVNDYISVPFSDYEIKLVQVIEFKSCMKLYKYEFDENSDFQICFDDSSLMCLRVNYYGIIEYISVFGYILNNIKFVNVSDDILTFNLTQVSVTFKILDIEKFKLYTSKFHVFNKEIESKLFRYTLNKDTLMVYDFDGKFLFSKE